MFDFIKSITNWAIEKEEELAKQCAISVCDINEQIAKVKAKKEELIKKCKEEQDELEHLLDRLHFIKAEAMKCQENSEQKS